MGNKNGSKEIAIAIVILGKELKGEKERKRAIGKTNQDESVGRLSGCIRVGSIKLLGKGDEGCYEE